MARYAILTDLNRCVGCLSCSSACKTVNNVPIGNFWIKVLRVGPNPGGDYGGKRPNIQTYFLPLQCQHCKNPECVSVCPTEASHITADGTVQIDKSKCIGCQFCVMACPYGVRYLNSEEKVVEKCTLCEQKVAQGELPQCVAQCGGRARYFGDLDQGIENFVGPADPTRQGGDVSYESVHNARQKYGDVANEYAEAEVRHLPSVGNDPSFVYVLRGRTWQGEE